MSYYNTYARTVISDNPVVADYIKKYSGQTALLGKSELSKIGILEDAEIDRAFTDPHSKYILKFIVNLPHFLLMQKEIEEQLVEVTRQRTLLEHVSLDLDRTAVMNPDVDVANKAMMQLDDVDVEYRRLLELHIDILKRKEDLKKAFTALDVLLSNQEKEWEGFRAEKLKALVDDLESSQVELIEDEKQQILAQENWSELLERVKDAKVDLPKRIDIENPKFETYYQLKDYLAKHASLGRRMLPNSMAEIEKL